VESGKIQVLTMATQNEAGPTSNSPRGGVCYICGVLFPLVYLLSVPRDRQNRFLRFHCFQCLFLFTVLIPLLLVRSGPLAHVAGFISLILLIAWIVAMIQAQKRKVLRLPLLGYIADRLA
jgi:uncharacterized membrane protein